jgi:hypothetical protein
VILSACDKDSSSFKLASAQVHLLPFQTKNPTNFGSQFEIFQFIKKNLSKACSFLRPLFPMFFELTSATLGVGPHFAYLNCEAKKSFEFDRFENLQKKLRMWRFSTEGMKEALDGNFG